VGIDGHAILKDAVGADADVDLKEIVMGLHWHPQEEHAIAGGEPANLDALCVLFDSDGRGLEVIHPGHPRNANGSVVHTGDSPAGASAWDDERIFVFLESLPEAVSALIFVVASANRLGFGEVPGASCHVSDRITEREWIRLDLTTLGPCLAQSVATLRRGPTGWRISPETRAVHGDIVTLGQKDTWFQESKEPNITTTERSKS
jgi:tellurium resistance protein TerD